MYYENEYSLLLMLALIIANMLFVLKSKYGIIDKIITAICVILFIFCIIHLGIVDAIGSLLYGVFISFVIPSTLLAYIIKGYTMHNLHTFPKDRSNYILKSVDLSSNQVKICKDNDAHGYLCIADDPKQYALDHAMYFSYIDNAHYFHSFTMSEDRKVLTEKESIRKYVLSDKPYVYILKKKK